MPTSCLSEDPQDVDVSDELVTGLDGIVIDDGLHRFLAVKSDSRILEHWVLPTANVKLTSSDEHVLGSKVRVCRVVKDKHTVDAHQFVHW